MGKPRGGEEEEVPSSLLRCRKALLVLIGSSKETNVILCGRIEQARGAPN